METMTAPKRKGDMLWNLLGKDEGAPASPITPDSSSITSMADLFPDPAAPPASPEPAVLPDPAIIASEALARMQAARRDLDAALDTQAEQAPKLETALAILKGDLGDAVEAAGKLEARIARGEVMCQGADEKIKQLKVEVIHSSGEERQRALAECKELEYRVELLAKLRRERADHLAQANRCRAGITQREVELEALGQVVSKAGDREAEAEREIKEAAGVSGAFVCSRCWKLVTFGSGHSRPCYEAWQARQEPARA